MTTPTPPDMPELKSCPCCKGRMRHVESDDPQFYFKCGDCQINFNIYAESEEKAFALMNTRPTPPADAMMREGCSGISYNGVQLWSDRETMKKLRQDLHEARTVPQLKKEILELRAALSAPVAQVDVQVEPLVKRILKEPGVKRTSYATILSAIRFVTRHYHLTPKTQSEE